jgi:hypothetical protein
MYNITLCLDHVQNTFLSTLFWNPTSVVTPCASSTFCIKECCKLKALTPRWRHNIEYYRFNYNRLIHVFVVQFDINKYSYSISKHEWNLIFLGSSRIQALISKTVLFKLVLKAINLQWPLFGQAPSQSPYIGTTSLLCVFMRLMYECPLRLLKNWSIFHVSV